VARGSALMLLALAIRTRPTFFAGNYLDSGTGIGDSLGHA
jgi:hypothetical protein